MKRTLLTIFVIYATAVAFAYDYTYPYLTFTSEKGTKSISVEGLQLVVDDGMLIATNIDGTYSFVLSELNDMFFSDTATEIKNVIGSNNGQVEIFTVQGISLGIFSSAEEARKTLKRGFYILKQKNGITKMSVR